MTSREQIASAGRLRARKNFIKAHEQTAATRTPPGRMILEKALNAFTAGITEWVDDVVEKDKPGPRTSASKSFTISRNAHWAAGMTEAQATRSAIHAWALVAARTIVDHLHSPTKFTTLGLLIGKRIDQESKWAYLRHKDRISWRRAMRTCKSMSVQKTLDQWKTWLNKLPDNEGNIPMWSREEHMQVGASLLMLWMQTTELSETYLVSKNHRNHKRSKFFRTKPEVVEWALASEERYIDLKPYWMPTEEVPEDWDHLLDGGHAHDDLPRLWLIKTYNYKWLKANVRREMPEVYSAVNTLQRTAWEVNPDLYDLARHYWDKGLEAPGMPSSREIPHPGQYPQHGDDREKVEYLAKLRLHHHWLNRDQPARILWQQALYVASQNRGSTFHYAWQLDYRGRFYPMGSVLTPQGTPFAKSLMRFARGEQIRDEPAANWLRIHLANTYGLDKEPYEARVEWVESNLQMIRDVARDPYECDLWHDADSPWEFVAACKEYVAFLEHGWGFVSKIPVAVDGTCNGLQVYSLLLRDPVGGLATNCIGSDRPQDIYTEVASVLWSKVLEYKDLPSPGEEAKDRNYAPYWVKRCSQLGGIPRSLVKRSVMTLPYGVTQHTMVRYVQEWLNDPDQPGFDEFEGFYECRWLAAHLWEAIAQVVVAARDGQKWITDASHAFSRMNKGMVWTVPTNFEVAQYYMASVKKVVKTSVNDQHSIATLALETNKIHGRKAQYGSAPNFVHSLDAAAVVRTVNYLRDKGVRDFAMIHDSFGVPAGHSELLYAGLRKAYADLFSEPILENVKAEWERALGKRLPDLPERGSMDPREVYNSPYFFS